MPTFRTAPSANLTEAVRRLIASGGGKLTPMQEMQADTMAAEAAHKNAITEKVRQEVEQSQLAFQFRNDPDAHARFAGARAGITREDDSLRYGRHVRGVSEEPSTADEMDANIVGRSAQPFRTAAPVLEPGQNARFMEGLAASYANLLGAKPSDANDITNAAGNVQQQNLAAAVQDRIRRGEYFEASAMNQGAKPGTQIRLHDNIGNTGATFAPATGNVRADPAADPTNKLLPATLASEAAQAEQRRAAAEASRAAAEKSRREKTGSEFKDVTTLRKEFNDQPEVKSFRDVISIVESARGTPDTRAGDIQMAYAVGKILDPNSVVREGELKLVGDAATLPEKLQGELRTLVMGKGRMTPTTRAQLMAMLDNAVDQREKAYLAAEATYRGIAERNGFQVDQVIINPPKRKPPGAPAGEVQARKTIGAVEFVKINGQWYQP